jgi:MerR family transcriptional regulator, repressor of the yfmOP operon
MLAGQGEGEAEAAEGSKALRISEAARACGVTARTLRYWQEIGLIVPGGQRDGREGGERLYLPEDLARAARIKELQDVLGFSLCEIKAVLESDDAVDEVRAAYQASADPKLQMRLLADAIDANARLLDRVDDTLKRVQAFREERAEKAKKMRAYRRKLQAQISQLPDPR